MMKPIFASMCFAAALQAASASAQERQPFEAPSSVRDTAPKVQYQLKRTKPADLPDLTITEAGFDPNNPSVWVVRVKNIGGANTGPTVINLSFQVQHGDERSAAMRVPGIAAGATVTLTHTSDVRKPFLRFLKADLDFADLVEEANEGNNGFTLLDRSTGIRGETIDPDAVPVLGTNIGGTFNEISKEMQEAGEEKKKKED